MDKFWVTSTVNADLLALCEKFRTFDAAKMIKGIILSPSIMGIIREETEAGIKGYEDIIEDYKLNERLTDIIYSFLCVPSQAYLDLVKECVGHGDNQLVLNQIDGVAHEFSNILEYGWRKYAFEIYIGDAPTAPIFPSVNMCISTALKLSSAMKMEDFPIHSEHITSTTDYIVNFLQEQQAIDDKYSEESEADKSENIRAVSKKGKK